MDGVHDLGGMQGFGPVDREENEPTFHAAWEAAVQKGVIADSPALCQSNEWLAGLVCGRLRKPTASIN